MARKAHRSGALTPYEDGDEGAPNQKAALIKSAATQLFLKDGFEGVTMDMVAKTANVSKSTLYAHFADKKDLFSAVILDEVRRANDAVWAECDSADVEVVLRALARNYFKVFMTERFFAFKRTIIGALPRFPEIGEIVFEGGPTPVVEKIAALLAAACQRNLLELDDPHMAAILFMGLIRSDVEVMGMFSVKILTPADIDNRINAAIRMFLAQYGKRSGQAEK